MVSDTFDHTSQLKLIRARFGVPVPNMTAWRDGVVGDMTSAFNFATPPNSTRPNLSHPLLGALPKLPQCIPNVVLGTTDGALPSIPLSGALSAGDANSGNHTRPRDSQRAVQLKFPGNLPAFDLLACARANRPHQSRARPGRQAESEHDTPVGKA